MLGVCGNSLLIGKCRQAQQIHAKLKNGKMTEEVWAAPHVTAPLLIMGEEKCFREDHVSRRHVAVCKGKAVSRNISHSLCPGAGGKANANTVEPVTREGRGSERGGCGGKYLHPSAHKSRERTPSEKPQGCVSLIMHPTTKKVLLETPCSDSSHDMHFVRVPVGVQVKHNILCILEESSGLRWCGKSPVTWQQGGQGNYHHTAASTTSFTAQGCQLSPTSPRMAQ